MSTIDDIRAQRVEKIKLLTDRGLEAHKYGKKLVRTRTYIEVIC